MSPVYVGPGDEVMVDDEDLTVGPFKVIGYDPPWIVCESDGVDGRGAPYDGFALAQLRTPDGRPVAGFRKKEDAPYMTTTAQDMIDVRDRRIAELERERDEAITAATELQRGKIEALDECDALRKELREVRDGKLGG